MAEGSRHNISFHYINPDLFKNAPKNKGSWTEIVYYRLLIPNILKEYDKAIYCDTDVLFKDDLSEVYNINLDGYEMAAVPVELNREGKMICHKYFPENTNDKIYISSFLVFNNELMRKEKTVDKFFEVIKKIDKRLKFFDLDTLNIALDRFLDISFRYGTLQSIMYENDVTKAQEYEFLSGIYSKEDLEEAKEKTVLIHYAGKMGKPWRMKNPYPDYLKYMNELPKELKQYTFRDIRKKLFSKE